MENFHSLCLRRFTTFAICVALLGCAVFAAPVEKAYAAPQNTITGDQAHIKVATVKSGTLNVRAAASTSSALKGKLHAQETARAAAESGNWVFVANSRVSGWVSKEFVTLSTMSESAYRNMKNVAAVAVSTSSANGSSIVSLARQQLGKRYVHGTAGPHSFDCSGLVNYCYSKVGKSVPRSSSAYASFGNSVSLANAQPGDILCFTNGSRISHVGIYSGGGMFVHASTPQRGVRTDSVYSSYYSKRLKRVVRV